MRKIPITLAILLVAMLIALVTLPVICFEKDASSNIFVNISKRIVAEMGAVASRILFNEEPQKSAYFGPYDENAAMFNPEVISEKGFKASSAKVRNASVSEYVRNFKYEDFNTPELGLLRSNYELREVTKDGKREFDKIVMLRDWVKGHIPWGRPRNVDYNFNALDILARSELGDAFFCSEYSTVFVQCVLSLGITARYVGLFKGHIVTEVWSDDFSKWVVMDVNNGLFYERDGIPLNALELHDAWEARDIDNIKLVKSAAGADISAKEKEALISFYHEFYISMRNNWFSKRYPHWHHMANSIMNGIEWQDSFTGDNILVSKGTKNREELYFSINITEIKSSITQPADSGLELAFNTFTPGFSHFQVLVDGEKPVIQKSGLFRWDLKNGANRLAVRAVNMLGIKGPLSEIDLVLEKL